MNVSTGLLLFALCYLLVMPWVIVLPWLRGTGDLICARNLFLVGTLHYFGLTVITLAGAGESEWIMPPGDGDLLRFVGGVILVIGSFLFFYHRWKWPARRGAIQAAKPVPSTNAGTIYTVAILCTIYSIVAIISPPPIPVVLQLMVVTAVSASVLAVTLCVWHWLRNRFDPIAILFVGGTALWCLFATLSSGTGRRDLLSLLLVFPIVFYWAHLRYRNITEATVKLATFAVIGLLILSVYSGVRHGVQRTTDAEGRFDRAVARLQGLASGILGGERNWQALTGDNSAAVTFVCFNEFHREGSPEYFHSFRFILLNPIPREFIPDKPEGLGETLPRDLGVWKTGRVNWGPGIVGHAYHDGGLWMTVIYGFILGGLFRWFDELLRRHPENPYRLGIMAAMSPQLIALSRGDIGVFGVLALGSVAFGIVVVLLIKMTLGGEPSPAPDPDVEPDSPTPGGVVGDDFPEYDDPSPAPPNLAVR